MTLLQIYELYHKQLFREYYLAVKDYTDINFAEDIATDTDAEGNLINSYEECYNYLKEYIKQERLLKIENILK
jgi:hypothetical protein